MMLFGCDHDFNLIQSLTSNNYWSGVRRIDLCSFPFTREMFTIGNREMFILGNRWLPETSDRVSYKQFISLVKLDRVISFV